MCQQRERRRRLFFFYFLFRKKKAAAHIARHQVLIGTGARNGFAWSAQLKQEKQMAPLSPVPNHHHPTSPRLFFSFLSFLFSTIKCHRTHKRSVKSTRVGRRLTARDLIADSIEFRYLYSVLFLDISSFFSFFTPSDIAFSAAKKQETKVNKSWFEYIRMFRRQTLGVIFFSSRLQNIFE